MTDAHDDLFGAICERRTAEVCAAIATDPALAHVRDEHLGSTALHFAAHRGLREVVLALLAAGADVHAREQASETTPLHWAAEGGHPAVIDALVAAGASLDAVDAWFRLPPLGWATVVEWSELHVDRAGAATALRAAGAPRDPFVAVALDDAAALRALGPDAVARRLGIAGRGMTPLHLACARGKVAMAELAIELDADLAALTDWGESPIALALGGGHRELADRLRARGASDDLSAALAADDEHALATRAPRNPEHLTDLLFAAAAGGHASAALILCARGADPAARRPGLLDECLTLITAHDLAAQHGHAALADQLRPS